MENIENENPESTENTTPIASSAPTFEQNSELQKITTGIRLIKGELNKVIVGQTQLIDGLIIAILANGNCLIEGVPGIAKTLSANLLAKTMQVGFARIQFTPDLMPSDILGTSVFDPKTSEFEFKPGPIFSNIILVDEINRAPAKTQSALFEVMAEKQITMDGTTYTMKEPFMVLATQNPIEQEGTYRLPEAQLDRFLFKINIDYPSLEEEKQILAQHNARKGGDQMDEVKPVLSGEEVKKMQQIVQGINVEKSIQEYIASVVFQTRSHPMLYLGASPRASLAILDAAKAKAAMMGRDFVIPEDVKYVAPLALAHRVVVAPEKEMEGISATYVVQELIEAIEIPR